jgi:hypothetical protein
VEILNGLTNRIAQFGLKPKPKIQLRPETKKDFITVVEKGGGGRGELFCLATSSCTSLVVLQSVLFFPVRVPCFAWPSSSSFRLRESSAPRLPIAPANAQDL